MLRPKDVTDQLGISAPTLRVWSNTFAPVLSPGAQSSRTETGGAAQRRYTEQDLAYFRNAKELLDSGSTFEHVLESLQAMPIAELLDQDSQLIASVPQTDILSPVVIEQTHPVIKAFEEALKTKDQVIASKDETIAALNARIEELQSRPVPEPKLPEAVVIKPIFRWGWLNRLLTAEGQDVG